MEYNLVASSRRIYFFAPHWTCRAGEALEKAVSWCRDHQLEFDAINDNLPEIIEMYDNNSRKITCDYYIDDKAVLPAMVNG